MPIDEAVERLRAASGLQETVAAFRLLAPRAESPQEHDVVAPRVFDLGIDAKAAERTDVAEECFRFALAVARGSGNAGLEAGANNYLGILALEDGRLAAAAARFEAAQRLREAARPRPTDDAWVYLAGTIVNLGNTKLAGWDATGAAECYAAATARFREAESAGSRTRSLAPFRANAERSTGERSCPRGRARHVLRRRARATARRAAAPLRGRHEKGARRLRSGAPPGAVGGAPRRARAHAGRPAVASFGERHRDCSSVAANVAVSVANVGQGREGFARAPGWSAQMDVVVGRTRLELVEGDIADQATDAVVTAAHWDLGGGQGTDGSIHFRAGPELLAECRRIGACPVGGAVLTRGYALAARYVIHAVGPVWERGRANEAADLASAYDESLKLAARHELRSISFPSISTGAFNYPMHLAAPVAMRAIVTFLERDTSLELVRMVLYPRESARALSIYETALRDVSITAPAS